MTPGIELVLRMFPGTEMVVHSKLPRCIVCEKESVKETCSKWCAEDWAAYQHALMMED